MTVCATPLVWRAERAELCLINQHTCNLLALLLQVLEQLHNQLLQLLPRLARKLADHALHTVGRGTAMQHKQGWVDRQHGSELIPCRMLSASVQLLGKGPGSGSKDLLDSRSVLPGWLAAWDA